MVTLKLKKLLAPYLATYDLAVISMEIYLRNIWDTVLFCCSQFLIPLESNK